MISGNTAGGGGSTRLSARSKLFTPVAFAEAADGLERADPISCQLLAPEPKRRIDWRFTVLLIGGLSGLVFGGLYMAHGWRDKALRTANAPASDLASRPGPHAPADLAKPRRRAAANPKDEAVLMDCGRDYMQRKDLSHAEEVFRSVLRNRPENRDAVLALSHVLYEQGKFEESAAVLIRLKVVSNCGAASESRRNCNAGIL